MSFQTIRYRLLTCLLTLALLPAIPGPAAAEATVSLPLDTTWRGGPLRNGADRFRLDVPEPGILTLDVSAPADAETPPTVEVLGDVALLYQSPASLVVAVPAPGAVFVTIASEDSERPLERYKLRNAFTARAAGFDKDVAERREDDDPPPSSPVAGTPPGFDKDVAERREDDDPPPFVSCSPDGADDHTDTPLCATPLDPGRVAGGELDNAFGDDEDYFTFVLTGQQTVAIAAAGEDEDVLGVLYDARGQRLTVDGRGQLGGEPRLVRTLAAGRYFVRVESLYPRAGSYTLSVTPLKSF